MKKLLFFFLAALAVVQVLPSTAAADVRSEGVAAADSVKKDKPFKAYLYNEEYKVYLKIDFYDKNITVPGQGVYGELDGYIGSKQSSNVWLITSSEVKNAKTAVIEVINDFGSEDFTATLRVNADGSYTMKKQDGSTLKFAVRGKWQKLPGTVELVKKVVK